MNSMYNSFSLISNFKGKKNGRLHGNQFSQFYSLLIFSHTRKQTKTSFRPVVQATYEKCTYQKFI